MKNFTSFNSMKAIVRLASVLCVLFVGVGNVWGDTDTYNFNANGIQKISGPSTGAVTASSADVVFTSKTGNTTDPWTITFTGNTWYGYGKNNGVNFGVNSDKNKYAPHATLTSKSYSNVTDVTITYSGNSAVTLAVSVGGTSFGSTTSGSSTSHSFTHAATTGAVVISVESSTNGQFKINSVTITYSAASCSTNATVSAGSNSSVTSTTATVTCASGISSLGSAGCNITSYGFVLNTTGTPTISDTKHQVGTTYTTTGTSFSKNLTSLTPNTTYYVRPYATNGNGTAYGTQTSFTTLQRYTISYNNNGGSGSMASSTKDHGVSFTLPANAGSMTKTGHHITGWLLGSSSGTHYDLSGSYTTNTDAAFYVEWTLNQWTLTWNWGGGSTTSTSYSLYPATSGSVNYGSSITKPANGTMNKTGYDFSGWSSSASTMPDNNLTITAQWTAQKYNITYKDQGGGDYSGSNWTSLPAKHTYGNTTALVNGAKTGYTFVGWYTDETCTVSAGSSIGATAKTAAFTLYAKWTANTYSVAFNANGGSGSTMSPQDFTYDEAQNLSHNSYTAPTHKYFIGWNTNSSASTALYTDGQSVSNLTPTANKTVTLYAIWKDHTYTNYRTLCCTEIAEVDGQIGIGSISETACRASWTLTGANTGIDKFILKVYDAEDNLVKTIDNISASATYTDVSGLTPCTEYYVTLTTVSSGVYCEGAEQGKSDNFITNAWAVHYDGGDESEGALLSHVTKLTGEAGACTSANYVATFRADIGYDLPTTVSVNIGGDNELTEDEDYSWGIADGVGTLTINTTTIDLNEEIYIRIIGVEVGCLNNPTLGAARLNGAFSLSTIGVSVGTSTTGSAYCAWEDYGFVWSTSSSPALNADGTEPSGVNKVQAGTSGNTTTWDGSLTGSFSTGTTYYFRAYGKNSKDGGAYAYSSSDATFTPRRVTFNSNGGSEVSSIILNNGGTVSAPSVPTKTGYTFSKWQLGGEDYDFSSAVTGNITLDAVWTANEYEVTFDKNGGQDYGDNGVTATYGAAMPSYSLNPRRTGYTFMGYYDAASDGKKYYNADKSSALNWDKATDATLYAQWTPNNYTITLNNEGADTGKEGTASISVTYDSNENLTGTPAITKPVKTDYLFSGYYENADAGGKKIIDEDGNVIASVSGYTNASKQWIKASSPTLHAYWRPIYTVTWSVNGEETTEPVVVGEKVAALPTAPTRSDCDDYKIFVGWRAEAIDGTSASEPDGIFTTQEGSPAIEGDVTFYAVFADENSHTNYLTNEEISARYCSGAKGTTCGVQTTYNNGPYTIESAGGDWENAVCAINTNNISIRASAATISEESVRPHLISPDYGSTITRITINTDNNGGSSRYLYICASATDSPNTTNIGVGTAASKVTADVVIEPTSPVSSFYIYANDALTINSISVTYGEPKDFVTTCATCTAAPTFNEDPAVSAIGCTGATVTATDGLATLGTGDGCNIRSYGFVWGTSANPTVESNSGKYTVSENIAENTAWAYNITGLSKGTHYYVRAYAENKSGISYSDAVDFWTQGVSSIAITTSPTKTRYIAGETFDATGMAVTATMANEETEDVSGDVSYSDEGLIAGTNQDFTIRYSLCDVEKTTTQKIDVYAMTVTEGSNTGRGEVSYSTGATFSIGSLETHWTAEVLVTNGTAKDNGDGSYTVTPNGAGAVSVTVNYIEAVQVNVYYKVDGVTVTGLTQSVYQSETTTLPSASDLATAMTAQSMELPDDSYPNFIGWSESEFGSQSSEPTLVSGTPTINAEKTYYAVYTNIDKKTILPEDYPSSYVNKNDRTIDGITYYIDGVGKPSSQIQFRASETGYFYSKTSLSYILRVEVFGDNVVINACSDNAGTLDGEAITPVGTAPRVYTFPENKQYFQIKGNGSTNYATRIDIYYSPAEVEYMTRFCTKYAITGASTSGTAVTGGTLTSSYNSLCSGKSLTLSAAVTDGYAFEGWTITGASSGDMTSTLLGANASSATPPAFAMPAENLTVSATITEKKVTGWTFTNHVTSAEITSDPIVVYVNQKVQLDIAYSPEPLLSSHKTRDQYDYTRSDDDTYVKSPNKAGTYFTFEGKATTNGNNTSITLTHKDDSNPATFAKTVNIEVRALPKDQFLDLVHGVEFDDQAATLTTSEGVANGGVAFTYTAPGSDQAEWTDEYANTCEQKKVKLVGWVESEYADACIAADSFPTTDALKADSEHFFEVGTTMTASNKTYYAVWAEKE